MKLNISGIDEIKEEVLEQLYKRYSKLMYCVAYDILRDHYLAEDAVQTTFYKLAKNNFKVDSISCKKTKTFVVIITRNVAISKYNTVKTESIRYEEELIEIPDDQFLPLDLVISKENTANLHGLLATLDHKYADVVLMKYFCEYSTAEIASLFGVTEQLIRVRLHRAKRMLTSLFEEKLNE
ncbi:MAG: RNA polymerase sigma factor [Christensenellales bacterium]